MTICPACGRENAGDARFCSGCGAALEASEPAREVRKVVTVVFSDLVGSTNLGERLDPESLRRVMSRYFDQMQACLERHGGTVEKFIGDAIMAVFGMPTLHEDDALRAVRSAAEMQDELARLNTEFEREHGLRIAIRTGVNTGLVVAGDASSRQKLATGDAVNVAARLEQVAGSGEILLGDETYRLVRDAVKVEPLEPVALKGKSEPLGAWRLIELVPEVPAFTRPIAAPFVGRAQELAELEQAFERAASERICRLATIAGPPGVGKSRLAREFVGALGSNAQVVVGRCLPYGEGITYWPLAEIVHQLAGAQPELKLPDLVADEEQANAVAACIVGAIGAADAAGSPEETAWSFRKLFEALARERPLLVVVDDIHWAQPTLLDLLEYLVTFSSDAPILLLCLTRPDVFDSRPSWVTPRPNATLVVLAPLSEDETEGLIERLLGGRELNEAARTRIVETAEGNPLFVEQILALQAEAPDEELVVPPTIQALLAARIDRLEHDERAVLERASVEGRLFHRGAVAELLAPAARVGVGTQLMSLIRKEFLRPDRTLFAGDDGFRFNHILIRDAAYDSMPKQLRAELHERYADWLEQRANGNVDEFEEILAYHLEQSYRYRSELGHVAGSADTLLAQDMRRLAARAEERLEGAGTRALARGDVAAAVNWLSRAAALAPREDPRRLQLLISLGGTLVEAGDFRGAESALSEAVAGAAASGDRRAELRANLELLCAQTFTVGESARTGIVELAREAIPVFEAAGDDQALARTWQLVSDIDWTACHWAGRVDGLERALTHARRAGDRRSEDVILFFLSSALFWGPESVPDGIRRCEEMLESAEGRPAVEGAVLSFLAGFRAMQGRFADARGLRNRGADICAELGLTLRSAAITNVAGTIEMLAGDAAAAEREWRRGYELLEEMGDKDLLPTHAALLADAVYTQGRYEEAIELSSVSERTAADDDVSSLALWRAVRGKALAGRGDIEQGEALAEQAVRIMERTDMLDARGNITLDHAEVLRLAGKPHEAARVVEQAHRLYEQKGNLVSTAEAAALLIELQTA